MLITITEKATDMGSETSQPALPIVQKPKIYLYIDCDINDHVEIPLEERSYREIVRKL